MDDHDFGGNATSKLSDSPEFRRDQLVVRLMALMTPSERAEIRGKSATHTVEESILEWAANLVNDRQNLQNAVDGTLEGLRKAVYDLGNA